MSSFAFAAEFDAAAGQNCTSGQNAGLFKCDEKNSCKENKDPIKMLEEKKKCIMKECKEGKISKEKADELIKKIDEHISKIKEFQSLPLDKKKEQLYCRFKSCIEKQVKEGKLTEQEAKQRLCEFAKELEKWDGNGFPKFMSRPERPEKSEKSEE
jgi:polyhydroxyalkanoate synthesis regulator phasin